MAAEATHVSRWSTAHPKALIRTFENAINHKGFSFVEIISSARCRPAGTSWLGLAPVQPAVAQDHCVQVENASKMEEVEAQGKIPVGDFSARRSRSSWKRSGG